MFKKIIWNFLQTKDLVILLGRFVCRVLSHFQYGHHLTLAVTHALFQDDNLYEWFKKHSVLRLSMAA